MPNHDSAVYVLEAQRLLAGARFYRDILDTNPPLVVLVTAPGVLLSTFTGLELWTGFTVWICFLIFVSWILAYPYLRWAFPDQSGLLLSFAYLAAMALFPTYDFSQREHITILLSCPAILWFAMREAGREAPLKIHDVIALVLAAVGLLLKPFFLVVPIVLAVARAASRRDWRLVIGPEAVIVGMVSLLYVGLLCTYFRDSLASILLTAQAYFGFNLPWWSLIWNFKKVELAFAACALLTWLAPVPEGRRVLLRQLILAAGVFLILAFFQRKGFSYHVLPTALLTCLASVVLAIGFVEARPNVNGATRVLALGPVVAILVCSFFCYRVGYYLYFDIGHRRANFLAGEFPKAVGELAAGRPWLALDTNVFPAFPTAVLINTRWSSRSDHQWIIPAIVKLSSGDFDDRAKARQLQRLATRFVVEDINKNKPVLVAVAVGGHVAIDKVFEFLPFFSEDKDFREAWGHYHLVKLTDGWRFYLRGPDQT